MPNELPFSSQRHFTVKAHTKYGSGDKDLIPKQRFLASMGIKSLLLCICNTARPEFFY